MIIMPSNFNGTYVSKRNTDVTKYQTENENTRRHCDPQQRHEHIPTHVFADLGEFVVVDEVGSVPVDERAEGEAVLEAGVEVLHVDVLVGRRLALTPEQETLLSGHLLHADVLDGEPQDDGPDHAQRHLQVTVHDLCEMEKHVMSVECG